MQRHRSYRRRVQPAPAVPPATVPRAALPEVLPAASVRRIEHLPRDVGWLLVTAGVVGEIAPGVMGTPFWLMGRLVLWPGLGRRMERLLERRAPWLLRGGLRQMERFLGDLERRYPLDRPVADFPTLSAQSPRPGAGG